MSVVDADTNQREGILIITSGGHLWMYNVKNWMLVAQDPLHNNGRIDFVPYTDDQDRKFLRPAMCTEGLTFFGILSSLKINGVTYPFLYIYIVVDVD
jgi:hypothetical protein